MTRARGRADIERMLSDGKLERVPHSLDVSRRLLADATAHVRLAGTGIDEDPSGALQLSYDAARKACAALLAVQGLRATVRGGHVAVIDAVRAQLPDRGDTAVFGRLHRLRRRRNATEYPDLDSPGITHDDARRAIDTARATVNAVERLLAGGRIDAFR